MTREEAIKVLEMFLHKQCDLGRTEFAYDQLTIWDAVKMASDALEQEPDTWCLDDAREDFMHDVYNTLDFLPTNDEANRIIDSFDRVTSSIKQEPRWIPATERLPEVEGATRCLVTVNSYGIDDYTAIRSYFTDIKDFNDTVTAWMPLPEPYNTESTGGENDKKRNNK